LPPICYKQVFRSYVGGQIVDLFAAPTKADVSYHYEELRPKKIPPIPPILTKAASIKEISWGGISIPPQNRSRFEHTRMAGLGAGSIGLAEAFLKEIFLFIRFHLASELWRCQVILTIGSGSEAVPGRRCPGLRSGLRGLCWEKALVPHWGLSRLCVCRVLPDW